jgi:hypothetical protein
LRDVLQVLNLVIAFILEAFFEKESEQGGTSVPSITAGGSAAPDTEGREEYSMATNPHFVTLEETL